MLYRKIEKVIEKHLKSSKNKVLLIDGDDSKSINLGSVYLPIYFIIFF